MKKVLLVTILLSTVYLLKAQQQPSQQDIMNFNKLRIAYSAISQLYVDETNNSALVEDAIKGMLEKLDPHSSYTNAEETRRMNEPLEAQFDGIGIEFSMVNDTLVVVHVISGGPSEKVGLIPGDRIVLVDTVNIAGTKKYNTDIQKLLRGKKGTEVTIYVKREGTPELLFFRIVRDKIPLTSIDAAYMADRQTGYIRLSRFAATSNDEFLSAFSKLRKEGMKNLVLDLQHNGGGYLNVACMLADQFLEKDKLIVYTQGNASRKQDALATEHGVFQSGKLIILVDEQSASASEIVSGAVQDWDRGIIIGRRTFGKGLVQRAIDLPDSSLIRLTTARYYTPSGRNIQKPYQKGNKEDYYNDFDRRFTNGEMLNADSIHFPDSLKYSTLTLKRTVYGGGGIMPDVFIPVDSTRSTPWHRKLISTYLINAYTVKYVQEHRSELKSKYPTVSKYIKNFIVGDAIMDDIKKKAEEEKIEFNEEQYNKSLALLTLQIKALIAKDLFDSNEYYQVINEVNDSLIEALKILNDEERYSKILSFQHNN